MNWNTLQERLAFTSSLVVLLGAAFFTYQVATGSLKTAIEDIIKGIVTKRGGGAGPQSPVRIVGGSIKFSGTGAWTLLGIDICKKALMTPFSGDMIQKCIISPPLSDTSGLTLTGVDLQSNSTKPAATGWLGLDATWKITAYARNASTPNQRGVDICVSDGKNCGAQATTPTQIIIAAFDNNPVGNGAATLTDETVDTLGYRYYDPNYNPTPHQANNQLEYMNQITVTIGGNSNYYKCTDGICQIYVGN